MQWKDSTCGPRTSNSPRKRPETVGRRTPELGATQPPPPVQGPGAPPRPRLSNTAVLKQSSPQAGEVTRGQSAGQILHMGLDPLQGGHTGSTWHATGSGSLVAGEQWHH